MPEVDKSTIVDRAAVKSPTENTDVQSFIFTPGHLGVACVDISKADHLASERPNVHSCYAAAAKRAADKLTLRAPRPKRQRPVSRWSFTLESGLVMEGLPLTHSEEGLTLDGVPLTHSGVSCLLDEIDLLDEAEEVKVV